MSLQVPKMERIRIEACIRSHVTFGYGKFSKGTSLVLVGSFEVQSFGPKLAMITIFFMGIYGPPWMPPPWK